MNRARTCGGLLTAIVITAASGAPAAEREYPPTVSVEEVRQWIDRSPAEHPRLLASQADLAALRRSIDTDPLRQALAKAATPTLVGNWREVRKDDRQIAIVISQDLPFRQTERGTPDFSGRMQLNGNELILNADDGSREIFTVELTAKTVTFYDDRGARLDFFWRRQ